MFEWPQAHPPSNVAKDSIRRLATSIAVARGLVASGRSIDLGGLDSLAGLLCAQILDLEYAEATAIRPELITLRQDVAGLMDTLRATIQ